MHNNFFIFNFNELPKKRLHPRIPYHNHIDTQNSPLVRKSPILIDNQHKQKYSIKNKKKTQINISIQKDQNQLKNKLSLDSCSDQLQRYKNLIQKKYKRSNINKNYQFPREQTSSISNSKTSQSKTVKRQQKKEVQFNEQNSEQEIRSMQGTIVYKLQLQNRKKKEKDDIKYMKKNKKQDLQQLSEKILFNMSNDYKNKVQTSRIAMDNMKIDLKNKLLQKLWKHNINNSVILENKKQKLKLNQLWRTPQQKLMCKIFEYSNKSNNTLKDNKLFRRQLSISNQNRTKNIKEQEQKNKKNNKIVKEINRKIRTKNKSHQANISQLSHIRHTQN